MQRNSLKMSQSGQKSDRSKGKSNLTRLFGQMTKWSCFFKLQLKVKSLQRPRKMPIGNHAKQSNLILWIFCVIFLGWIQNCDVIVFSLSTRKHENSVFKNLQSGECFRKVRFRSPFSPDTHGRKANPQRKSCVFKRKWIRGLKQQLFITTLV